MRGFDLVCKNCGNTSSLDNIRILLDYLYDWIEIQCLNCDNEETYEVEEK